MNYDGSHFKYDPNAIEPCIAEMRKAVQDIEDYARQLSQGAVQMRNSGGMQGHTADAFVEAVAKITNNLDGVKQTVGQLAGSTQTGSDEMYAADKKGSAAFS